MTPNTPDPGEAALPEPGKMDWPPDVIGQVFTPFQGMLECRAQDEGLLIKNIIIDFRVPDGSNLLPTLPAYVLFMCIRHADHCKDANRIRSLFTAIVKGIRQIIKVHNEDLDIAVLWLSNICRLTNCMKQYSGEQVFSLANTPAQNRQHLKNFDLCFHRDVMSDLTIKIYQHLIGISEKQLKPTIIPAMFENASIPGLTSSRVIGLRKWIASPLAEDKPSSVLGMTATLQHLTHLHEVVGRYQLPSDIAKQIFRQLFHIISGTALNYLLMRKDICCWNKGLQIRYNVSQLEDWLQARGLLHSNTTDVLQPLIQTAQLLQMRKKTEDDAEAICNLCTALSPQQVLKILRQYTPVDEFEERVPLRLIEAVQSQLQTRILKTNNQLLVDMKTLFALHVPFSGSSLPLDQIAIPHSAKVGFLRRI